MINLTVFSISGLLLSVISFVLVLIILKYAKTQTQYVWAFFNFSNFLWGLGTFFIGITKNATFSLLAWRLSHIGIFFIPIFLFHFIYLLCGLQKRLLLFFAYLQGIIFVSLIISGNYFFVSSIRYIPSFSFFYAVLGPLYHIPFFIWIMLVLYSHYELFRFYLRSPAIKRNQLSYLFFGTLIGFLGGITNFLPAYNIDIYPYGNFTIPIYCLIVTYAIIRYHLMDIEIFIKKTTIITIGVIFPVALLYIGLSYVQPILYPKFGPAWLLIPVILSIAIAAGLFRFVKFILRMNEADLSKKFAYRPMLEKEAERTSKARDVREMATFIVRDVSSFTRLDHTAVFILNEQKNAYSLISSVYRKKDMPKLEEGLMLSLDSPLVAFLKVEKKPAVYGQIMHDLQNKDLTTHERKFLESVESAMAILGTEISVPSFCEDEMVGIMNLGNKITGEIFTGQDLQAFQTLANQTGRAISGLLLKNEKVRLIVSSQKSLLETLEARDHYTRGHTERVSQYCQILGRKLERMIHTIPNSLSALNWTAQLHDLGKVGISDTILLKPAPLNDEEFAKIKEHPTRGIEILGPLKEWFGDDIIQGVVHHHENYDGTGYPDKQKGEQIHVFARIIRVADAFDAMTTDRPYRKGLTLEQAIAEIKKFRKIQFDPIVADGFLELCSDGKIAKVMEELKKKYG